MAPVLPRVIDVLELWGITFNDWKYPKTAMKDLKPPNDFKGIKLSETVIRNVKYHEGCENHLQYLYILMKELKSL